MPLESFQQLTSYLLHIMQLSIVVPMVVVWRRQREFSPAIKLLSWYVYLSAFFAVAVELARIYLHNNLVFLMGFNAGKILLFAAVYSRVLPQWQRLLRWVTIITLVGIGITAGYDMMLAPSVARLAQCAVLAGFALLYLDFTLVQAGAEPGARNPLWLLSVGQLVYSAGTVTAFATTLVAESLHWSVAFKIVSNSCLALSGLAFNALLTLAFLRASPDEKTPLGKASATRHFVKV